MKDDQQNLNYMPIKNNNNSRVQLYLLTNNEGVNDIRVCTVHD